MVILFEFICCIIFLCMFIYMAGPAIISVLGSFFGGAIAIVIVALSLPITLLLTRKDRKNNEAIYEHLQAVRKKGNDYLLECSLSEQLEEAEKKVGNKMQLIIVFHIIAITAIILYFYMFG